MGLFASNSAENEWCAIAVAEKPTARARAKRTIALFLIEIPPHADGQIDSSNPVLGSIVLAIIYGQFFPSNPLQIPTARPRFRIRAWIINRYFIFQGIQVRSRILFDQVELIGMGKPTVGKPKLLVETLRIDDECLAFPLSD